MAGSSLRPRPRLAAPSLVDQPEPPAKAGGLRSGSRGERTPGERAMLWLTLGGIALGCGFVLRPFVSAILWAGILVFASWPLFRRLRAAGLGRSGAAALMVGLTAVIVVLPIAIAVPSSADDVNHLRNLAQKALEAGLPVAPHWLAGVPLAGGALSTLWNSWAADLSAMGAFFRPYFGMMAEAGLRLLLDIADSVLGFMLALFIAFFFYLYGEKLAGRLLALLRRLGGERADRLVEVAGQTVRGTIYGILGTAVVQGMLTFCGLWLAGVPRASLLGVIAGLISILPIGAPLVWIPASVWLVASGKLAPGIFLATWGVVLISGADHLIRPYFIARGAQLPFLLTVLGVLGGALSFGLVGVFLGPALLGVGYTLLAEFAAEGDARRAAPAAVPSAPPPAEVRIDRIQGIS